ncbi:MAG: sigma-70 family RNA polymerase sigma factor [Bacilli bacterium]|nr:sigma-70 family RNA polymerase sigma factor [Bacilli bacterium]
MYKDENDYELLYLIKEENEEAKEMFYEKYRPIVEMKAKKFFSQIQNKGYELNDLIQEGMIGLSNAIKDYNEDENVKFITFANVCIERNIINFIREINRQKHQALNSSISIDEENKSSGRKLLEVLNDNSSNPENSFIFLEEQEELKEKVKKNLTDFEKDVFDLRFEGFTYQEISILLNKSIKSIDGTISRIKQKIINNKKNID